MSDLVERFAIRCARGNNGGEWAPHYTEEQKEFWRGLVSELVGEVVERSATIVLRDYFAGQAMAQFTLSKTSDHDDLAASAYAMADAMLKARA